MVGDHPPSQGGGTEYDQSASEHIRPYRRPSYTGPLRHNAPAERASGAECQDEFSPGFSSAGKYFLLTFPLIEPMGRRGLTSPDRLPGRVSKTAPLFNSGGFENTGGWGIRRRHGRICARTGLRVRLGAKAAASQGTWRPNTPAAWGGLGRRLDQRGRRWGRRRESPRDSLEVRHAQLPTLTQPPTCC
jgi:hypothetical protein